MTNAAQEHASAQEQTRDGNMHAMLHPMPAGTDCIPAPLQFTNPFCYTPHPLCVAAAKEVIDYCYNTPDMMPHEGKMFGVLVVSYKGSRYYLCAFSGIYNGSYHHKGFVPPVYDLQDPDGYFQKEERRISHINQSIATAIPEDAVKLKALRKEKSNALQMWTFKQFRMHNAAGETNDLLQIFKDHKTPFTIDEYVAYKEGHTNRKPKSRIGIPPGGAGECCAPKLLQYAYINQLKPLCMEEFWIGPSKRDEMRTEGHHYPACQHKCVPILGFMLKGLNVEDNPHIQRGRKMLSQVRTIFEDPYIIVIYKPSGLLSVPSKNPEEPSLSAYLTSINNNYILVHRLDMDTSGIMLVAKNQEVAKQLQAMFYKKEIKKKYITILDEPQNITQQNTTRKNDESEPQNAINENNDSQTTYAQRTIPSKGTISLPLSRNPLDAPRQTVDHNYGKQAITHYAFVSPNKVELFPETGRTHQLRIHCAHPEGLGRPIKGDALYGTSAERLFLHAERIELKHPVTGEWLVFEDKEL